MEADDGFFLRRLQTEMLGHPTAVLIHPPIALPPGVELAQGNAPPRNEAADSDLGLLRPASDEIDHLIPHFVRNPSLGQSSQGFFLTRCAPPSVRPGSRPWSAPSSPRTQSASVSPRHGGQGVPSFGRRPMNGAKKRLLCKTARKCVFHRKAASTGQKALTLRHIER